MKQTKYNRLFLTLLCLFFVVPTLTYGNNSTEVEKDSRELLTEAFKNLDISQRNIEQINNTKHAKQIIEKFQKEKKRIEKESKQKKSFEDFLREFPKLFSEK